MPDHSRYEQRRIDFVHGHRTSLRTRRKATRLVWSVALAVVIVAVAVRALVVGLGEPLLVVAVVVAMAATVVALRRPAPAPHAHGLPGVPDGPCPSPAPELGPWVIGSRFAGPLTAAAFAVGSPAWVVLGLLAVTLVLAGRVAVFALGVRRHTRRIARALAAYEPRFAIAYAGYGGGPTHLTMWEEPLLSAGFPGVVLNYREKYCQYLRDNTDLTSPFVQISTDAIRDLKILIVPSLKWFFYLHNANSNARFMAMPQVKHVWLGHGDSDKPASVFARHARYDLLVVSGTAAIERYESGGVHIPREKFVVLGRPQVHEIEAATGPIPALGRRPVVLYAPTWQGKRMRVNFSSLRFGADIVQALIAAGADVIFRPHPLSKRHANLARFVRHIDNVLTHDTNNAQTPGHHHYGELPNQTWSLNECMNRADALVSDVSSVVSDWLQSGKPYAMVSSKLPVDEFRERFPVARGAYVLTRDLDGAQQTLADMLGDDSMEQQRDALRVSVLGGFKGRESAEAFAAYFHDRFAHVGT